MKTAEKIRLEIETSVRDGTLLPGEPIDEDELINRYNVSRTPVREAMLQLQAQELLSSLPRGGMVVAKMDMRQLLAMWELLAELEGICARLACERMTLAERASLARMHRQSRAVVKSDDREGWKDSNLAFHEVLYQGARNPYLRQEILRVRSRTGAYRRHAFDAFGQLSTSWGQHGEIVAAVTSRDAVAASNIMVRHLSPGHGAKGFADFVASLPKELLG